MKTFSQPIIFGLCFVNFIDSLHQSTPLTFLSNVLMQKSKSCLRHDNNGWTAHTERIVFLLIKFK